MLPCYTKQTDLKTIQLTPVDQKKFATFLKKKSKTTQHWLKQNNFTAQPGMFCVIPNAKGQAVEVVFGQTSPLGFWVMGNLSRELGEGVYQLAEGLSAQERWIACLAWGLGAYQFTAYKKGIELKAQLLLPEDVDQTFLLDCITSTYLVRDLINTSADDMGPAELAEAATHLAEHFKANVHVTMGEALEQHYPAIYAVGKGSQYAPRLVDLTWGDVNAPKVTLVGKGVCFDTGGLDIKTSQGMQLMKKDMGGAAHVLGLAYLIMSQALPIRLRVIIAAVENAISDTAMRPSDVIYTHAGKSVEIGNTDAEGRLVLADCLSLATEEQPDLLIDFATLTGAARTAVGPEILPFFLNQHKCAQELLSVSQLADEILWQLPLYAPYLNYLRSDIADLRNDSIVPMAGAMTAALFLQSFVPDDIAWVHFVIYAWNLYSLPGKPIGGEAQAVRTVFRWLKQRYLL